MNNRIISRHLTRALLTALGMAFAGGAPAQDPVFYAAPGLTLLEFDNEAMLEDGEAGFTFALGVDFDRRWSAELGFLKAEPAYVDDMMKADLDAWQVKLRYTLGETRDRLRPYLSSGVGNMNVDGENDTLLDLGVGVEFELRDQVVVRSGVSSINYLGRGSDIGFNAGLVYYFGERNPPPPPPEPVAPPPPPDADGDGVPDPGDDCPDTPSTYAVDDRGCPILIEEIASFELRVNFDFDESVLRDEDIPEIEELAEFLREYDGVMLHLEGHTDNIGTPLYNLDLSQRRADAVRDVLIEDFGISPGRVTAQGYGEQLPVADNDSEAGREANRRVVAVVAETLRRYRER